MYKLINHTINGRERYFITLNDGVVICECEDSTWANIILDSLNYDRSQSKPLGVLGYGSKVFDGSVDIYNDRWLTASYDDVTRLFEYRDSTHD